MNSVSLPDKKREIEKLKTLKVILGMDSIFLSSYKPTRKDKLIVDNKIMYSFKNFKFRKNLID